MNYFTGGITTSLQDMKVTFVCTDGMIKNAEVPPHVVAKVGFFRGMESFLHASESMAREVNLTSFGATRMDVKDLMDYLNRDEVQRKENEVCQQLEDLYTQLPEARCWDNDGPRCMRLCKFCLEHVFQDDSCCKKCSRTQYVWSMYGRVTPYNQDNHFEEYTRACFEANITKFKSLREAREQYEKRLLAIHRYPLYLTQTKLLLVDYLLVDEVIPAMIAVHDKYVPGYVPTISEASSMYSDIGLYSRDMKMVCKSPEYHNTIKEIIDIDKKSLMILTPNGQEFVFNFYVRFFRYEPTTVARLKKFIQTNRDLATIMFENFDREALESVFKIADKKKSGFRKCKTLVDLEQFLARLDANHSIETKYDQLPTDYKQRITKAENDLKFAFDEDHVAALQKRLDDLWREADRWLVDQSRKNMVRRNVCVGVF